MGGLRIVAVILALEGCASQDPGLPKESRPPVLGDAWQAPLVLRPGPVAVNMQARTRASHSPGLGGEVFCLSITALFTFGGSLLDLPNVVARHQTDVLDLPKECAENWVAVMNRPQWLGTSDARTSALDQLAGATKLDLEQRGKKFAIAIEPIPADDPRSTEALTAIGTRHAAPVLAVVGVLLSIEPQPKKCSMLMRVSANMHLEKGGAEPKSLEAIVVNRARTLSVEEWAKDPVVGMRTLDDLLVRMGQDIVSALPASQARQAQSRRGISFSRVVTRRARVARGKPANRVAAMGRPGGSANGPHAALPSLPDTRSCTTAIRLGTAASVKVVKQLEGVCLAEVQQFGDVVQVVRHTGVVPAAGGVPLQQRPRRWRQPTTAMPASIMAAVPASGTGAVESR